jgi:hypothetical protein
VSEVIQLQAQLEASAAADDAWLRERAKARYQGVERDEYGCWWATVLRTKTIAGESWLLHVWFPGTTAAEALGKARAWVEEQLAKAKEALRAA